MKRIAIHLCIALAAIAFSSRAVSAAPIKLACIGDSITFGAGVKDRAKDAYPAQMQDLLGKTYKVSNCGTSGIQMRNYLKRWGDKITAMQPDIVTIKLGTNDTHYRDFKKPDNKKTFDTEYRNATLELLEFLNGLKSYDATTGKVAAIKANGSLISFNIDLLHPDDQKYVKEQN